MGKSERKRLKAIKERAAKKDAEIAARKVDIHWWTPEQVAAFNAPIKPKPGPIPVGEEPPPFRPTPDHPATEKIPLPQEMIGRKMDKLVRELDGRAVVRTGAPGSKFAAQSFGALAKMLLDGEYGVPILGLGGEDTAGNICSNQPPLAISAESATIAVMVKMLESLKVMRVTLAEMESCRIDEAARSQQSLDLMKSILSTVIATNRIAASDSKTGVLRAILDKLTAQEKHLADIVKLNTTIIEGMIYNSQMAYGQPEQAKPATRRQKASGSPKKKAAGASKEGKKGPPVRRGGASGQ